MIIASEYSFRNGKEILASKYITLLNEIREIIEAVNANLYKTKKKQRKNDAWENVV